MTDHNFDIVILGGGSGGYAAATKKDCNGRSDPCRGKSIGEGYAQIKILRN